MYEKKRIKLSSRPTMPTVTLRDIQSRKQSRGFIDSAKDWVTNTVNTVADNLTKDVSGELNRLTGDLSGFPNMKTLNAAIAGKSMNVDSASFGSVFSMKGKMDTLSANDVLTRNLRDIALLRSLSAINGLPPVPDNVVDPPVEILVSDVQAPIDSWTSGMVGRDYVKRVLSNGQFLVLVPIELQPRNFGALGKDANDPNKASNIAGSILSKVENRLDVTSYGFHTKVNSFKYWKAVQAHFKTALIALGIQNATDNKTDMNTRALFMQYMPDELVDKVLTNNTNTMFATLAEGNSKAQGDAGDTNKSNVKLEGSTWIDRAKELGSSLVSDKGVALEEYNIFDTTKKLDITELQHIATNASLANVLKWVTNVDLASDEVLQNMPFTIYYCNGPVERSLATSTELGESVVARMSTDLSGKAGTSMLQHMLSGKAGQVASIIGVDSNGAEEYIKELAFHGGFGSMIVANTWIPKVIKNSMLNQTYTVNIKETVASSDRFSKARVQWTLCQLIPYVTPTNEPGQPLIMPRTTMYCSASVKGVMNLPRAAITSMSVRTAPEFQTSEGIPTELDISLTIQPLYDLSAMPDFDKWYNGAAEPINLAASMYNPQSSFNLIATMCGQNTVLTKFNAGMFEFFIGGTLNSVVNSVRNTGNTVTALWRDFKSSGTGTRTQIMSTLRLF